MTETFISLKVAYNSDEGINTLFNKIGLHMAHSSMLKIIKHRSHSNTAIQLTTQFKKFECILTSQNTNWANACHSNNIKLWC